MIGPARAEDMPAITDIYAPLVETSVITFEIDPPDAAEMTRRWHALVDAGYDFLVAHDDDGIVQGYAYSGPFRSRAAYRYSVENSVYIHPKAQRKGRGVALMDTLITASQARGFAQMIAVVTDTPDTAYSLAFHDKLGFERAGTLHKAGFKFRQWLDVTFLQRPL
ncbi:MAG: N-acetyltransferase family protein [Pseudomonadota bacterium]